MKINIKNEIIQKAWEITKKDLKIKKYYFISWVFSIIFLSIIFVYQFIYTYVELLNYKQEALVVLLNFFHSDYFLEITIWLLIFLWIYMILIPIFEWALISYINEKHKNISENDNEDDEVEFRNSIWVGIYRFLPFFEYSNIFTQFKFISLVNIYLFCLRFVWIDYAFMLNYIFLFLFIISTIINILFSYAKFEIILNNKKATESIASSSKLALINIYLTSKMYIFMFFLNIRIFINFFAFLLFPIIIVLAITYITTQIFLIITIIFLSIIFILTILFLWYLSSVMEIFKTSIWFYTYLESKKNMDKMSKNINSDEKDEWDDE